MSELNTTLPQRQAAQPDKPKWLAYYAKGNIILHRDGSRVADCADDEVARHVAKRLRATLDILEPEQAIAAAKQALADAIYTLERLSDRPGVPRTLAIEECRTALALLGGRPV
jgi:hypothetical protein